MGYLGKIRIYKPQEVKCDYDYEPTRLDRRNRKEPSEYKACIKLENGPTLEIYYAKDKINQIVMKGYRVVEVQDSVIYNADSSHETLNDS